MISRARALRFGREDGWHSGTNSGDSANIHRGRTSGAGIVAKFRVQGAAAASDRVPAHKYISGVLQNRVELGLCAVHRCRLPRNRYATVSMNEHGCRDHLRRSVGLLRGNLGALG